MADVNDKAGSNDKKGGPHLDHPIPPAAEAPAGEPADQDVLFRLQMAASDFLLGHWQIGAWALLGIVVIAGVYGGVTSFRTSQMQEDYAAIAAIDFKMPKIDQMAQYGLAPIDDPSDTARLANVEAGADRYLAAADDARGAAAVYGYLKAADAYTRVGKKEQALAALQKASDLKAGDMPGFTADAALASALIDAGQGDRALALYREMVGRYAGFFSEQSLYRLASAQLDAGRTDDARATIQEFTTLFPGSPRAADWAELTSRAGSGG